MTEQIDPRDEQWARALSGSPDSTADPRINREAQFLREALEMRRDSLDTAVPAAGEALYRQVEMRLTREGLRRPLGTRWKNTLAFALAAFALGVAVARLTMLPAAPAMRSATPSAPTVSIRVEDPVQIVEAASRAAIRLGLPLGVTLDRGSYQLVIDGFVPGSPAQQDLRDVLGLNASAGGRIIVIVQKK